MATEYRVPLPGGKIFKVWASPGDDKQALLQELQLSRWEDYCLNNWIGEESYAGSVKEQRIKKFLDACAYIMLRDNPEDTLSFYKEAANRKREIPVSSCPTQFEHHLYSGQQVKHEQAEKILFDDLLNRLDEYGPPINTHDKPKKNCHAATETRSQRVSRVRARHPGCTFHFCRVDTENVFIYDGAQYEISASLHAYQPKETKHGLLYDMDQMVVVRDAAGDVHYYTQQYEAIAPDMITAR